MLVDVFARPWQPGDPTAWGGTAGLSVNVTSRGWIEASTAERFKILFHEYFHVLQFRLSRGMPPGPTWLIEGGAEYAGFTAADRFGLLSLSGAKAEQIPRAKWISAPLRSMETPEGFQEADPVSEDGDQQYEFTFVAVDFLVSRTGAPSLLKFCREIGEGAVWEQAFRIAFGKSPGAFYREFEEYRSRGFTT